MQDTFSHTHTHNRDRENKYKLKELGKMFKRLLSAIASFIVFYICWIGIVIGLRVAQYKNQPINNGGDQF